MKKITIIAFLVAGILLLTGCNTDQRPLSSEEYEAAIQTAIALTQVASHPNDSLLSDSVTGSGGEAGSADRSPISEADDSSSVEVGADESSDEKLLSEINQIKSLKMMSMVSGFQAEK